jgi:hypothetical protein
MTALPSLQIAYFALDERKRTTVLMQPNLFAQVEDGARQRGWSFTRFAEWCIEQLICLKFLSTENRDFVLELTRVLGQPWDPLSVIDRLIEEIRQQIQGGKLRPGFVNSQLRSWMK